MRKILSFSLSVLTLYGFSNSLYAATVSTTCSSAQTANSCNQCFYSDSNLYLGTARSAFGDIWHAGSNPDEIYLNDNPTPVSFSTPYPTEILEYGTKTAFWQGTAYTDPTYGPYLKFASNESRTLLLLDSSYSVGFSSISPAIRTAGRNTPIFELAYTIKYWEVGGSSEITHKECIAYYPAFCGDGTTDVTNGETCDNGAANGTTGNTCSTTCTTATTTVNPVCSTVYSGTLIAPITQGYCGTGTVSAFATNVVGNVSNYAWQCNGSTGTTPASCSARYQSGATVTPVCSTVYTGTLSSPITQGYCGTGTVSGFSTNVVGNMSNYAWQCNGSAGTTPVNCNARYQTGTSTVTPVCSTVYSGTLSTPITQGYCGTGAVSGFTTNIVGNISNYAWQCVGSGSVNCNANYQTGSTSQTGGLSVKKYVSTGSNLDSDAQVVTSAMNLPRGSLFNYIIVVANSGAAIASGAKVTDTLPANVTISGSIIATGWSCTASGNTGFTCIYTGSIASGATLPYITIPAYLAHTTPVGTIVKNVAAVCELTGATLDCTTVPNDCNPGDPNYNPVTNKCDPAVVVVTPAYDLAIKKYVKGDDVFAPITNNEDFNYNIIVQNNGVIIAGTGITDSSSGITTVTDTLPTYITLRDTPSGNGWTCTGSSGSTSFTCTTSAVIASNQLFPVITVPVRATNAVFQPNGIINSATVSNIYDNYLPNNTDSAAVNPPNPNGFDLMIHKYVNGDDEGIGAQSGNALTYTFIVENLGLLAVTGTTTITDTDFSSGITLTSVSGSGWTCTNTNTGFSCNRSDSIAMGQRFPTITAQATLVGIPGVYRNVVCLSNPNDPNELATLNPILGLYKVNNCNPVDVVITPGNTFDLMLKKRVGRTLTDGTLRDRNTGHIGNDEQDALIVSQSGNLVYTYSVSNLGPIASSGVTTLEDTLPNNVVISGAIQSSTWTCTSGDNGNRSFRCTHSGVLSAGQLFPDVIVYARTSGTIPAGTYANVATISNTGDINPINNTDPAVIRVELGPVCGSLDSTARSGGSPLTATLTCNGANLSGSLTYQYRIRCYEGDTSGTYGSTNSRVCTYSTANTTFSPSCAIQDSNGVVLTGSILDGQAPVGACATTITTSGSSSGLYYTCMNNSNRICASFIDANACQTANNGVPCTHTTYDSCYNNRNLCPTGGSSGYCGNGILEVNGVDGIANTVDDEQCDLGPNSDRIGCSSTCKVSPVTIPGEDPITSTYIYMPGLSRSIAFTTNTLLHDFDCNTVNNASSLSVIHPITAQTVSYLPPENLLRCDATRYQVVIGENSRVFTNADSLIFHLQTKYDIPVSLSGARVCIYTTNYSVVSGPSDSNCYYLPSDVVIGRGEYVKYQWADHLGTHIFTGTARGVNDVLLYTGSQLTTFIGNSLTSDYANGGVEVKLEAIRIPIQVRVSKNMVSSSAGNVYLRRVTFASATEIVGGFLDSVSSGNFTSTTAVGTTTTNLSTSSTTTTTTVYTGGSTAELNIITQRAKVGSYAINSLADFDTQGLSLSDYNDVYAIRNGNLSINTNLTLSGVKTVIVENGNLYINANILNNVNSSWSFIVRNGNIIIKEDVTSIAGIFVALPDSVGQNGRVLTTNGLLDAAGKCVTNSTQNILKIYGTLYGNATHLIACHTYIRANVGYDTVTTGIILNYSSRALRNPPPLLSRFLGQYNVSKVVIQ